jgi:uncharacterized protein YdeI (YjbR/CyaY-like superfamily)
MADDRLVFENRAAFRKWLAQNHQKSPGIWLVFSKDAEIKTVTANEALEEALCFGWIDGQLKSLGAKEYLKRFTPRRKGSVWSERNRKLAQKLTEEGAMTAAGRAAIEQAQERRTWDKPKPAPISEAQVAILTDALSGSGIALTNFLNMSPSVRRTYTASYLAAKGEDTRTRRLEQIIGRLKENKKPM